MKNSLSEPGTAWKSTDREAGGAREKEEPRGVCVCVEERGKQRERETESKKTVTELQGGDVEEEEGNTTEGQAA